MYMSKLFKILDNYFYKDINNLIISYITISEKEVKENYSKVLKEFKTLFNLNFFHFSKDTVLYFGENIDIFDKLILLRRFN